MKRLFFLLFVLTLTIACAALAESASSHPISKSLQKAYGKEIDRTRVTEIREISGETTSAVPSSISAGI